VLYTSTLILEPLPLSCVLGSSLNPIPSLLPCVTSRVHVGLPSALLGALHHTPQQNGHAEGFNRTCMNKARAMCLEACLPDSWWELAVEHTVHCYNRTPVHRLNWRTPFEALNKTAPNISHLQVFGCGAYVYLPQDMRKDKLAPKSELMVYLSVAEGIKGHCFMRTANNQLFTATTALFDEKLFPKCKTSAPKPITQVREPVSTDTHKPRTISWDDDDDDDESPVAWRPPHHFIPPPAYGAVPPALPAPDVTAKTATPTEVDSKLSDAHLESLREEKGEGRMPLRPGVESSAVRLHKRFYLASTGRLSTLFILHSSKRR
jgi:hypothetical protein